MEYLTMIAKAGNFIFNWLGMNKAEEQAKKTLKTQEKWRAEEKIKFQGDYIKTGPDLPPELHTTVCRLHTPRHLHRSGCA